MDPSFLSAKTALVNIENDKLYAMLESGRAIFPYVGLLNGPIRNSAAGIFPNAAAQAGGAYTGFVDYIQRSYKARIAIRLDRG